MTLQEKLTGTGVAVVTPFDKNGVPDLIAYEKLLNHIIEGGVEYVVALGTTGETPVLDNDEKIQIINSTYSIVNGRVPVVIGVGGNHTSAVMNDLARLPLDGAVAVLSASPYYNKPSQEGIYQHYRALAEVSPRPIILYNVPGRTGRNMNASTTLRLAKEVANIAGIKEASGDMAQCMEALPQMACGMDGVISVAANCFPKEFSQMVRDCLKQDFASARKRNDLLMEAYDLLFAENNPAGAKAFLYELKIMANELRLPLVPASHELQNRIRKYLDGYHQS
jgi:4-hydroxy-tetrahydrodipicolinate synthase